MERASRTFTPAETEAFAAVSGDWNPAHVDPLAARRLIAGGPIAHGVHVLLNQFLRNVRDIGRMLDETAQAVSR